MRVISKDFEALFKEPFSPIDEDRIIVGDYDENNIPKNKPVFVLPESPIELTVLKTISPLSACEISVPSEKNAPLYREIWSNDNPHEGPIEIVIDDIQPDNIEPIIRDDIFSREDQRKLIHHFL